LPLPSSYVERKQKKKNNNCTHSRLTHFLFLLENTQMYDGMQGAAGGVLRGAGKQGLGALVNLISFYVFGLPIAYLLTVVAHWGLRGTWIGLGVAEFSIMVGYLIITARMNWQDVACKAQKRAQNYSSILEEKSEDVEELSTITTSLIIEGDEEETKEGEAKDGEKESK
jgi:MATE family multidrug resistance protein